MQKQIYVRPEYEKYFKRLAKEADEKNRSISYLIAEMIKKNYERRKKFQMKIVDLQGKTISLTSEELKETGDIGKDIFDWLLDELERWSSSGKASNEDVENFKAGNWFVEIYIRDGGFGFNTAETQEQINNQPEWGDESWEMIEKKEFVKEFEKFLWR